MIKINKKVEYALIALKYIAAQPEDKLTSAREICDHFNTPFDTTAKVLQTMNNSGILNSSKGIKGGYSLASSLKNITFIEFSELVEGNKSSQRFCETAKGMCDLYSLCNIVTPVESLNRVINNFLKNLTLEELFQADIDPLKVQEENPTETTSLKAENA